jgi:hypothetical protein
MTLPTVLCREIESACVNPEDRFVVSLVFGIPEHRVASPQEALRVALNDVYARPNGADHIWCVYDREADECSLIQEGEVLEIHRPPGVSPQRSIEAERRHNHRRRRHGLGRGARRHRRGQG